MSQSMQSMSLAAAATPTQPKTGRGMRPTRPVPGAVRAWFRSLQVRSTLGPSVGDHALGESQWRSDPSGFAL